MAANATSETPTVGLATLCHERFYEPGWLYERKLDGERCLAIHDGGVRLLSRNGNSVAGSFPEIADAVAGQDEGLVLDGEVVAFEGNRTSFARLQPRMQVHDAAKARRSGVRVYYYVFDLLRCAGEDVTDRPLRERKRLLQQVVRFDGPLRYVPHRLKAGEEWFEEICGRGWEGLIVKRADAPYPKGRTRDWLKFKCEAGQELIVVGYTDPEGARVGLGALLLGYHRGEDLVYAGKVGTGFSQQVLRDLQRRLEPLEVDHPTCTTGTLPRKGVHWVRPELVAEIAFTEWTRAGQLRHPRYLGLRRDKDAADVVRE